MTTGSFNSAPFHPLFQDPIKLFAASGVSCGTSVAVASSTPSCCPSAVSVSEASASGVFAFGLDCLAADLTVSHAVCQSSSFNVATPSAPATISVSTISPSRSMPPACANSRSTAFRFGPANRATTRASTSARLASTSSTAGSATFSTGPKRVVTDRTKLATPPSLPQCAGWSHQPARPPTSSSPSPVSAGLYDASLTSVASGAVVDSLG